MVDAVKSTSEALEVFEVTGIPFSKYKDQNKGESEYNSCMIGLTYSDRQQLYDRINKRVDIMLENGLLDEARRAYQKNA